MTTVCVGKQERYIAAQKRKKSTGPGKSGKGPVMCFGEVAWWSLG